MAKKASVKETVTKKAVAPKKIKKKAPVVKKEKPVKVVEEVKAEDLDRPVIEDLVEETHYLDEGFDWTNDSLWKDNPEAVKYWLLMKT